MNHTHWMCHALTAARRGIAAGQSPFGCAIVSDNTLIAAGHNEVWLRTDPTAHAETVTLAHAAATLKSIDLSGCTLYTTCEPCPMCAAAIHWARIPTVVYGATIDDAAKAGFNELHLAAADVYRLGRSPVHLQSDVLRQECAGLFDEWKRAGGRVY